MKVFGPNCSGFCSALGPAPSPEAGAAHFLRDRNPTSAPGGPRGVPHPPPLTRRDRGSPGRAPLSGRITSKAVLRRRQWRTDGAPPGPLGDARALRPETLNDRAGGQRDPGTLVPLRARLRHRRSDESQK